MIPVVEFINPFYVFEFGQLIESDQKVRQNSADDRPRNTIRSGEIKIFE